MVVAGRVGSATRAYLRLRPALLRSALPAAVALICAAAYALTLAPGPTWANGAGDSAELIAVAVTGGVAHPPGYPTYTLLARLSLALPAADPAVRVTLLSAVAAALAAALLCHTVRVAADAAHPAAAAAAGLALGLAPLLWSQAVVAEVYALNALFAALLLCSAAHRLRAAGEPAGQGASAAALAAGLALGNHLTILPFVVAWLTVDLVAAPGDARRATLLRRLPWLAAGLAVYASIPLAAAGDPPISWGRATSWEGFWWLVSARAYAGLSFGVTPETFVARLAGWAAEPLRQLGPMGLALMCVGLIFPGRARALVLASGLAAAPIVLFAAGYAAPDASPYLIGALPALALWAGLGAARLLDELRRARPRLALPAAALILVALVWPAPSTLRSVDASGDRRAIDYARSVLATSPPHALVVTADDAGAFPLWYYHFALGERPDLALVTAPLLDFAWYRESLRRTYPHLVVPEEGRDRIAALAAANAGRGPLCRALPEPPSLSCR